MKKKYTRKNGKAKSDTPKHPPGQTQPALRRKMDIHERILSEKFPNAVTLAEELQSTSRTIKEDIKQMRLFNGAPIEFDVKRNGYYYTKEYHFLAAPQKYSEEQIFAMLVAHKAVEQYRGLPFEKPLQVAFKKLMAGLDKRKRYTMENFGSALSIRPFAPADADLEIFHAIAESLAKHRVLGFNYRNFATIEWKARRVHPYHISCIDNVWYLFAFDPSRNDIRTFVLARMDQTEVTNELFPPKPFDPDKLLKDSFGVMHKDEVHDVVVEFNLAGSDIVRTRKWHQSAALEEMGGYCLRMKMRLNSLEEVERWVLSFGPRAKVIGPPPLVERVKKSLAETAALYA